MSSFMRDALVEQTIIVGITAVVIVAGVVCLARKVLPGGRWALWR